MRHTYRVWNVANGYAVIGIIAVAGFLLRRTGFLDESAVSLTHRLTFFIATPALFFTALSTADVGTLLSTYFPVIAVVSILGLVVAAFGAWLFFREKFATAVSTGVSASYMNANFVGIPLATYVLGDAALSTPVMLFQLLVVSPIVLAIFDFAQSGKVTLSTVLLQPLRNPIIVASIAGAIVGISDLDVPFVVSEPLRLVGAAAVPLALLLLGMTFHGESVLAPGNRGPVVWATLVKLLIMPIAGWWLATFVFQLSAETVWVVVLLLLLPTGFNAQNYAMRYGLSDRTARDTIALTTLLAFPMMLIAAALLTPN
jgi:predicted permease